MVDGTEIAPTETVPPAVPGSCETVSEATLRVKPADGVLVLSTTMFPAFVRDGFSTKVPSVSLKPTTPLVPLFSPIVT